MNKKKYEMIFCIVNAGFALTVMEAAKKAGARGGTILRARGTANPEAEEFYQISIQPDKEILWLIVPREIKDDVMHKIYQDAGQSMCLTKAFSKSIRKIFSPSLYQLSTPSKPMEMWLRM